MWTPRSGPWNLHQLPRLEGQRPLSLLTSPPSSRGASCYPGNQVHPLTQVPGPGPRPPDAPSGGWTPAPGSCPAFCIHSPLPVCSLTLAPTTFITKHVLDEENQRLPSQSFLLIPHSFLRMSDTYLPTM